MVQKKRFQKLDSLKQYIYIILGSVIAAISINVFLVPNKIAAGGISGIATVFHYLFGVPVGAAILVLNIPLFILSMKFFGKTLSAQSLFGTAVLSIAIDTTSFIPPLTQDPLLSSIYGGIMMGIGLGMVFRSGATTGGTDLIAKVLHKFVSFLSLGQLLLVVDFIVIVFAATVFKDYDLALYAIITLFASSKIIDAILEGVDFAKAVFIISPNADIISQRIMKELDRGATGLGGKGMYTQADRTVLLCVLKRTEIPTLKSIVQEIDKNAFVILTDAREVLGEGFKVY